MQWLMYKLMYNTLNVPYILMCLIYDKSLEIDHLMQLVIWGKNAVLGDWTAQI